MHREGSTQLTLSDGETFPPVRLVADDLVPTSMLLLLVYPYQIDPQVLTAGFRRGLKSFPHLTGKICESATTVGLSIQPSTAGVYLDAKESWEPLIQSSIEAMTPAELASQFAPQACFNHRWHNVADPMPLFHASLTTSRDSQLSVLCLFASHMAVDGTGLILMTCHATAAIHDAKPPPVFHDRGLLDTVVSDLTATLPPGYIECDQQPQSLLGQWDLSESFSLGIFTVSVDSVSRRSGAGSLKEARLALAATLCTTLRNDWLGLSEVALWCDPRGTAGIPKTYTGNSGCYVHLPVGNGDDAELASRLRAMATRQGFDEIAKTFHAIKAAESHGHDVLWNGADSSVLPLNLVPLSRIGMDWGQGQPVFGQMLTRNSHGLRVWTSPDGLRFLVEAYLPRPLPEKLIERCHDLGLILSHRIEG
ncbi:MAG: hypothetical protein KDB00_20935 [Planctomycetales bacterium]|nr:hypothetical protein [Planctomycetales bacterium]